MKLLNVHFDRATRQIQRYGTSSTKLITMSNTADPQFREIKPRQGGAQVATPDLFRLDGRTVLGEWTP